MLVFLMGAALTAVGAELIDFDTQGLTCLATIAIRAVSEQAASPKAL
jgi:hypothetical protein